MAKVDKYFLGDGDKGTGYNHLDKKTNVNNHIKYMLNRSINMFKYHNLPDTLPAKELELLLQCHGYAVICKINDNLYAVNAGLGGECDVYGNPTQAIVTVPYLNYNATLNIDTDCIVMNNDTMQTGLIPMYQKYCTLLNENEITMLLVTINKRIQNFISANDDSTVQSARKFLENVYAGKVGVIAEQRLFDSLKIANVGTNAGINLKDLFEYEQYLKASLYNEIGLSANFNMKRERLTKAEVECNTDNLYPLPDEMLSSRREAIAKINEMFGTDITVEFNSSWDYRVLGGESIDTLEDDNTGVEGENVTVDTDTPDTPCNSNNSENDTIADEPVESDEPCDTNGNDVEPIEGQATDEPDEQSDEPTGETDEADEADEPIDGADEKSDEKSDEPSDEKSDEPSDEKPDEPSDEKPEVTDNEKTDSENDTKDSNSAENAENESKPAEKPENGENEQEIAENEQKKNKK